MVDLKEYFYNTNHYSDPIIKKFIYDFTDKFNPFLLIALNKEFVIGYATKMDEMDEWKVKKEFDVLENLIGKEELEKSTNILCRIYTYSEGIYTVEEVLQKYCNLSYSEHRDMTTKIQDFQFCMEEIIIAHNSKIISQRNITHESKNHYQNLKTNSDDSVNPLPLIFVNKEAYNCFIEYTKKHILEYYSDYSYLKKRLEDEKLIHKHTDNDFMEFLFRYAQLVTEKDYEDYTGKRESKLKSLDKSYSNQRQNNFNNIFEHLLESN